ncbi:unnamed protein product [Psylliodes chrysocephalus]|uniref:Uncharacterized protein n=1 Tax=Psylliodes chrysocephalus TaxID=3402493 RepID=A0A9P0CEG4_9CUCU|nr:unnamed protein product [Psylliodes chrysocephala]
MKLLVVLSAFIVVINATLHHESWSNFKLTHSKSYQNIREEHLRFNIFKNNLKKIEEHNAKYEKGEVSYYLAVNHFADMTSEEFMAMLNKQISNRPHLNSTLYEPGNVEVDEEKDWRDNAVLAVKDQGQCGSCWAFSTTGALEGQLAIKKHTKIPLSEQELVDCSTMNGGCKGGYMITAFIYVYENGLSSETAYKYTAQKDTCKKVDKVLNTISGIRLVADNEKALKTAVGSVGPISVAVLANTEWQHYGGGVFDHDLCFPSESNPLNHGVLAVGYGTDEKDYWIIKNSWGTSWGEDGYMRLVRGTNQCGVSDDASFPKL